MKRRLIFTLVVLLAITGLSLTSDRNKLSDLIAPTASCGDCVQVTGICGRAALGFYNACVAGGANTRDCEHDAMTWMNMCLSANGCPIID